MRRSQSARALVRQRAVSPSTGRENDRLRGDAEHRALDELDAWRMRAVPDSSTPLEVEDLVRLLRDCVTSLGLEPAVVAGFTTNTVHYYRRKDIIDPPEGRTAAARWSLRHLWQVAGARLAGHLGLVTLAQARDVIRGADTEVLLAFLAARVVDARARDAVRRPAARPATPERTRGAARPLSGRGGGRVAEPASQPVRMIHLPGDVLCIVPASHAASLSTEGARELGRALTRALLDGRTR